MRPGISSTANIGDDNFNLTVKRYDIPLEGKGKDIQVTNYARTVGSLAAGNTASVTVFNGLPTANKFILQRLRVTAMLTTSASAPKAITWLKCSLVASGSNNLGLSSFPINTTFAQSTIVDFYCSPSSYPAELSGPLYVQCDQTATIALTVVAYATITLNDIIQAQAQMTWLPIQ